MFANSNTTPKVLILHAYSPSNLGDGLLVKLAKEQVVRAIGECEFVTVCSDAAGFGSEGYIQWRSSLDRFVGALPRRFRMMLTVLVGPHRSIKQLADRADLIVAVGGGYLRGGHLSETIKSLGAHYGQVRLAARFGPKAIYLPQSIGPFRGLYLKLMRSLLSKMSCVFVRDDRSSKQLQGLRNVKRVPDLAIFELAETPEDSAQRALDARPIMVARDLRNPRSYYDLLSDVREQGGFEWAVQASGGANNDLPVTRKFAGQDVRSMSDVLSEGTSRVVVSTRLHGALSALISGNPAIHLSYERKGWGAFEDVGLDEFVLNARDASMADVGRLLEKIVQNPGDYWDKVHSSKSKISDLQLELSEAIRGAVRSLSSLTPEHLR